MEGNINNLLSELKELQSYKEDASGSLENCFDLSEVGCGGEVKVIPRGICRRLIASTSYGELSKLPNGLPPIFPSSHQSDLEEYLLHPEKLPIHDLFESQRFWPRKQDPNSLFNASFSSVLTTLKVHRNPKTGKLLDYQEVSVQNADCTGKNSTSLLRIPDPQLSEVKGSSTNIPFRPGGLDETDTTDLKKEETTSLDFENDLLCIPPGFTHRISFTSERNDGSLDNFKRETVKKSVVSIADIFSGNIDLDNELEEDDDDEDKRNSTDDASIKDIMDSSTENVSKNIDEMKKSDSLENLFVQNKDDKNDGNNFESDVDEEKDWAVEVDVNDSVKDFDTKVPEMAKEFKFKLDPFQKQAIVHLEQKECVFVAAHTSAGKTVVAEYAIALASKHMMKTIYTSPVKALSNQKFRDFKNTFESVGLITGDVQINTEASCLIMTTEILRSMLYRGSRVIRDTEWVIFDEVHYVNDAERGVVWEEVLIMLPDHVNIIMLSATVPNTKEFAGWVGRIKKKNIYVISTTKRPVPLKHFLYTGNNSKTSNELFEIIDTGNKMLTNGYKKAVDAKKQRSKKSKDSYGSKGTRHNVTPNEDRNIWVSIIRKLEKEDGLPVVAFTFSRTRCNDNANKLLSMDLTTHEEKHKIDIFIKKCVSKLKDQDANLPQVKQMQQLLKHGLAVHHSGILPILKEMIEILFQRGLVKLLFATETFAMGVNMPAKTVIFDSIRKHDGTKFRELLPGEYIQMAGRAGRRGLDKTGTVIILCKADVPEMADLQKMMLGTPTVLESRFRLTYSMILNLLRSDDLCVEDMMKRSFAEFHLLQKAPERDRMIKELEQQLVDVVTMKCMKCEEDMDVYYNTCNELAELQKSIRVRLCDASEQLTKVLNGQKDLTSGRVIVVNSEDHRNMFGIVLTSKSLRNKTYTVLVICDEKDVVWTEPQTANLSISREAQKNSEMIVEPHAKHTVIFCPQRPCGHKVIDVVEKDIVGITEKKITVESETIINDYKKRQIPRFRNDPHGKSITFAAEELLRLSETNLEGLPLLELNIRDVTFVEKSIRYKKLETTLEYFNCLGCLCFEEHFKKYREKRILNDRLAVLKSKSSLEMLSLNPEYNYRKKVLVKLGYLGENHVVAIKGRVALEISNHEIVISNLLLNNFFNDFEPPEIVALLSCFVFEQKKCSEPKLTEVLLKGKERIVQLAKQIAEQEIICGMNTSIEEFVEQFKFGLVEVVFEWARGMRFCDITRCTDVQEGIIVRCIQRLNELCRDVKNAAKQVGVADVEKKMDEASTLLKRDIVFAASLYLN